MGDLLKELQEAHRESSSWRLFGLCHQAATRIAALEAQLAERVKDEPAAFLIERLAGSGYGRARKVIDAAIYDPRRDDFWIGDGKKNHLVTPLYALSALEATPPAPKVTDAMVDAAERTMAAHYERPLKAWELTALHEAITAAQEAGKQ